MPIKITLRLTILLFAFYSCISSAETIRDVDYRYDGAGNIIEIISNQISGPPVISTFEPDFIRLPNSIQFFTISLTGSNFYLTTVAIDKDPTNFDIRIPFNGNNIGRNGDFVQIFVEPDAATGDYDFIFTNPFGNTSYTLTLAPRLPSLNFNVPNLDIPDPVGTVVDVVFSFGSADVIDHTFNFSVQDPSVASISQTSLMIPAGSTSATQTIQLTALSTGTTFLDATSPAYGIISRFVSVTDDGVCEFSPPPDGDEDEPGTTLIGEVINKLNFISTVLFNELDTDFGVSSNLVPIAQGLPGTTNSFLTSLSPVETQIDETIGGQCDIFNQSEQCTPGTQDICYQPVVDEISKIKLLLGVVPPS